MRRTDIVIIGGGLAGSLSAAMLGRAGVDCVLVDPHTVYPPDFRCEKLDGVQTRLLERTGLAGSVLAAATHDGESWVARYGRIVERRPGDQHGIRYDTLVNTVRAQIPCGVPILHTKATAIATSDDRQQVTLADGSEISARLIIMANGLNSGLRHAFGMPREDLSPCHSISIGFDIAPVGRPAFDFPALTYHANSTRDRTGYVTLFPIGTSMRANLFVYRDMQDPWLRQFRQTPREMLMAIMPGLAKFTGEFTVTGPVQIRPVDLYVTRNVRRAGIVLVGDAYATSCPAAGTGARKALNDAERLCHVHIPGWLASAGMGEHKIAAFYDDPVKRACDAHSEAFAFRMRAIAVEPGLRWRAERLGRFVVRYGMGKVRAARRQLQPWAQAAASLFLWV